ncbi:exopolysaccharide biosynthesis protein [Martelella sp. HB161492]|uniref:exopolysaccharide biosynthesis protein n=1 Tax=Martelella sp. HB161492 TaxID=2720726 RepID=UPI001591A926|nr:exopolysaccharide biosynthesis protein [Martelella sp. HB161492]
MSKVHDPQSLTGIAERALAEIDGETVMIGDFIRIFGRTAFTPLILLAAIVLITPISGIPGLSTLCGAVIVLVAAQSLFGFERVWLPRWIRQRRLSTRGLRKSLEMTLPFTRFLDRHSRRRMTFLFRRPFVFIPPLACILFGMLMPLMELIPFSSTFLGISIALLAFSLLSRDGLFTLFACLPVCAAVFAAQTILF